MINLIFSAPPGPDSNKFIEAEDGNGNGINVGEWSEHGDGYWKLSIVALPFPSTVADYLAQETVKVPSNPEIHGGIPREDYVSKVDGAYIGLVGFSEADKDAFFQFAIIHQLTLLQGGGTSVARIGFSEIEQKWYGWSHRAIYGFGIGSQVSKGDSGHGPRDEAEFLEQQVAFWQSEDHASVTGVEDSKDGRKGVRVRWTYADSTLSEKMRGKIDGFFSAYPAEWGKGEWTAANLIDARRMAIDFAESVG